MKRWMQGGVSAAVAVAILAGCNGQRSEYKPAKDLPVAKVPEHHHDEHAHGPHGGELIELGEEAHHAELVVDGKAHAVKLFLFGPDAKTPTPTAATEVTIALEDGKKLVLIPAAGQPDGQAAAFELVDEKVVHALIEAGFLHGSLQLAIGDAKYDTHLDIHFHAE